MKNPREIPSTSLPENPKPAARGSFEPLPSLLRESPTPPKKPLPLKAPLLQKPPAPKRRKRVSWKAFFFIFILFLLSMTGLVVLGISVMNEYLNQMPSIPYLEDYRPWMPSRIFSGDESHQLVADFFSPNQNREVVPLSSIPKNLQNAVIALEDIEYRQHFGISLRGFIRAAVVNFKAGDIKQGGSTLTMQLAEDLIKNKHLPFAMPEVGLKSFTEKLMEVFLALQIEKHYTKDEILEIYLNQIFLGGNIYGVKRAAESYFGKDIQELNLKECALFAGMLRSPNRYSPTRSLEEAEKRTAVVLGVMRKTNFISEAEYQQALKEPFQLHTQATRRTQIALYPYFSWAIQRQFSENEIQSRDGKPIDIYGPGIDVESTLDTKLQQIAESCLRKGIRDQEHRRRIYGRDWGNKDYKGVNRNGPERLQVKQEYDAKILSEFDTDSSTITVTVPNVQGGQGPFTVPVVPNETWLDDFDLLHKGYYIRVMTVQEGNEIQLRLAEDKYVQGALIAVQPSTGKVLALVGGYDYNDVRNSGQFIRAIQSTTLQPGSSFKPLLYTAALADPSKRWNVLSTLQDVEREFWTGWTPQNYEGTFNGPVPMRYALAHSLNAASVWLLDNFKGSRTAGIQTLKNFCRSKFDLTFEDSNLSIALGTMGVSPWQLAQAYAVLANQGDFVRLHMVEKVYQRQVARTSDLSGKDKPTAEELKENPAPDSRTIPYVLYEFNQPYAEKKRLSPEIAYLATYLMRGVVEEGTAKEAKDLPYYCVGKTGTTDDCVYAWFTGYTKDLLCVVYIGYDEFGRSLGVKMTGSKVALPVWMDFMNQAYELYPNWFGEITPPNENMMITVCSKSGKKATPNCPKKKIPFAPGTEPKEFCKLHGVEAIQSYQPEADKIIMNTGMDFQ